MFKLAFILFLAIFQISMQEEICVEKDVEKFCKDLTAEELKLLKAPTYTDYYGTEVDWQNGSEGWTDYRKLQQILMRRRYLVNKQIVPTLSGNGYFKKEMPNQIYKVLYDQKIVKDMKLEENCQESTNCKESFKIPFLHEFIVKDAISAYVRYPLEVWVGLPISETFAFDKHIIRYTEGTKIWEHVSDVTKNQFTILMNVRYYFNFVSKSKVFNFRFFSGGPKNRTLLADPSG